MEESAVVVAPTEGQPKAGPTRSYDRHVQEEENLFRSISLPSCYEAPDSVDAWRHNRMLAEVLPLIAHFPEAKWLTVGDGRFGSNAYFLRKHSADVTATSISSHTLEMAHSMGFIPKFAAANAENLGFADGSFDFVLCKEALHHFPRPAVGFYEMFRVCKYALVMIEPIEGHRRPLTAMKWLIKRLVRRDITDEFEPSGNFLYRISVREITKMLMGIEAPCLAWKGINDFYHPKCADAHMGRLSLPVVSTYSAIALQNALASLRLLNSGLAAFVCFKASPSDDVQEILRRTGFKIGELPKNPFTKS